MCVRAEGSPRTHSPVSLEQHPPVLFLFLFCLYVHAHTHTHVAAWRRPRRLYTARWDKKIAREVEVLTQSLAVICDQPVQTWRRPTALRVRSFTLTWHNVLSLSLSLSFFHFIDTTLAPFHCNSVRECTDVSCRQTLHRVVTLYCMWCKSIVSSCRWPRNVLYLLLSAASLDLYGVPGCPTSVNHISMCHTSPSAVYL